MTRKPLKLKSWEFVKTQRHCLSNIDGKSPEKYYYQYDGYTYEPSCEVVDFNNLPLSTHKT